MRSAAAAHGWGIVFDDPVPGDDVPVQLRQSVFVRPVRTVFDFLNIYPGYWEWDVGWIFLPFFSLFFAMIVGDAGYALLLLILTVVLQRRLKKVPAHVFHMMYIVGWRTLVWGVINGQLLRHSDASPASSRRSRCRGSRTATTSSTCASSSAPSISRSRTCGTPFRSCRPGTGPRPWRRWAGSWSSGRCSSSPGRPCSGGPCPSYLLYVPGRRHRAGRLFMKTPREFRDGVDRPWPAPADDDRQLRRHPLVHPPLRRRLRVGRRARRLQRHGGVDRLRQRAHARSPRACCSCSPTPSTSCSPASACSSTPCASTRSSSRRTRGSPGRATTCTHRSRSVGSAA